MTKKVLIIDDSALMRRVMSDIIEEDEQLTVVETAKNGQNGLELLLQGNQYDLILLDLKMPKMDGIHFLKEMRKARISIPVLIVSSIASESAKETIQALELGAFDFVKKPYEQVGEAFIGFHRELLTRARSACGLDSDLPEEDIQEQETGSQQQPASSPSFGRAPAKKPPSDTADYASLPMTRKGDRLFVIISSTGGPKALQSVVPMFPADFPYPIVVVQHMPAGFTDSLAKRLDELSPLHVKEAENGEILKRGCIYIAQGGKQCELVQKAVGKYAFSENDKPARGGLRPCADIFFESLVDLSFDEIICGVLTGMGADGSKGILLVKSRKKVKVVAQNKDTCVVYGMPKAAKSAGVVDDMVPLEDVAIAMMKKIGV